MEITLNWKPMWSNLPEEDFERWPASIAALRLGWWTCWGYLHEGFWSSRSREFFSRNDYPMDAAKKRSGLPLVRVFKDFFEMSPNLDSRNPQGAVKLPLRTCEFGVLRWVWMLQVKAYTMIREKSCMIYSRSFLIISGYTFCFRLPSGKLT